MAACTSTASGCEHIAHYTLEVPLPALSVSVLPLLHAVPPLLLLISALLRFSAALHALLCLLRPREPWQLSAGSHSGCAGSPALG
eukprot:18528-Heterococcus_DN1.PRE.5